MWLCFLLLEVHYIFQFKLNSILLEMALGNQSSWVIEN